MDANQPGWRLATGTPSQIDKLVQCLAATDPRQPRPGPADHGTALYLFDATGALRQRYAGALVDRQGAHLRQPTRQSGRAGRPALRPVVAALGFGEGLCNTIALKGRGGMGQDFLHWSANFDEVQDFEGQIRNLAGGTGLMSDALFGAGTRSQPLGDAKASLSADLDAMAAYLASLNTFAPRPLRNADGSLTTDALAGKNVFQAQNCASCHSGLPFTASADAMQLKNVGTLKPSSGKRLGGALPGIDVPTLRDV